MSANPKSAQRKLANWLIGLTVLAGCSAWMYFSASNRAAHGGFPLEEIGIVVLVVWCSSGVFFPGSRPDPFRIVGIFAPGSEEKSQTENEKAQRKRGVWVLASWLGLFVLDLITDHNAGIAFRNPSDQNIFLYGAWATVFIVYLYVWILAFPILDLGDAIDRTDPNTPRPSSIWRRVAMLSGLVAAAYGLGKTAALIGGSLIQGQRKFQAMQHWFILMLFIIYFMILTRLAFPSTSLFFFRRPDNFNPISGPRTLPD